MFWKNLKRLGSYYKPYKKEFYTDMVCAIISALIALVIPFAVRYVVNVIAERPVQEAVVSVSIAGAILTGLIVVQYFCNYYIAYVGHVMGAKIEYNMRSEIFEHYQKLSFSFYDNQNTGGLLSRITADLFDITELLHHGPENIVISFIRIVGAFIIMIIISPPLTLAAFILLPVMLIFAYFYNKRMKAAFKRNRETIGDVNAQVEDSLSGIRVVKSFANEDIENNKFGKGNKEFLKAKRDSYRYMGGYNAGLKAITAMMTVLVLVVGGIMISHGSLDVADMMAFLLYINVLTEPIKTMIDFTEMFQNGYSGFERFIEILDIFPDIQDKPGAVELKDVKGNVSFENVEFQYGENKETVFENVNLEVPAGAYYAIVGPSGIGKTTLVSLIPRFYDISDGSIRIDGQDIRYVTQKSLRDNIGVVQQDVYLFIGTVYENILYGRPDATREEVIEAAKNANAHDFIMALPDGYDTDIGQRGVKLSGGQKQRLSIARVFLKNPPILIFDEATSALDNDSERIVQESMDRLAKNRTTFVIAHRLTTVRNAGKIIEMTKDGIRERETEEFFENIP